MKKIEAIIKQHRLPELIGVLQLYGIPRFRKFDVEDHGTTDPGIQPRIQIEFYVEFKAEEIAQAIHGVARSSTRQDDGEIAIIAVERHARIL